VFDYDAELPVANVGSAASLRKAGAYAENQAAATLPGNPPSTDLPAEWLSAGRCNWLIEL